MNKNDLFCVKILCLGLFLICSMELQAQQNNDNKISYWADAGIGWTSLGAGGGTGSAGIHVQLNHLLLSLQLSGHGYSDSFIFAKESKDFTDYGALVGIATLDSSYHASISAGMAIVSGKITRSSGGLFSRKKTVKENLGPYLGLLISSQLFWKAGANFGIGIKAFTDINSAEILSGVTLSVFIGEFY